MTLAGLRRKLSSSTINDYFDMPVLTVVAHVPTTSAERHSELYNLFPLCSMCGESGSADGKSAGVGSALNKLMRYGCITKQAFSVPHRIDWLITIAVACHVCISPFQDGRVGERGEEGRVPSGRAGHGGENSTNVDYLGTEP